MYRSSVLKSTDRFFSAVCLCRVKLWRHAVWLCVRQAWSGFSKATLIIWHGTYSSVSFNPRYDMGVLLLLLQWNCIWQLMLWKNAWCSFKCNDYYLSFFFRKMCASWNYLCFSRTSVIQALTTEDCEKYCIQCPPACHLCSRGFGHNFLDTNKRVWT